MNIKKNEVSKKKREITQSMNWQFILIEFADVFFILLKVMHCQTQFLQKKTILFSKKTWFSVSYIKRMETWLDEHNNHVFRMGFHFPQDLLVISLFRKIHQNILRYIRQYPDRSLFHWISQKILKIIFAITYMLAWYIL